jgi:hypothetical protein
MRDVNINEKTKIPLFTAIGLLPFLVGGVFWLANLKGQLDQAEASNIKQDQKIDQQYQLLLEIRDNVLVMKTQMDAQQSKTKVQR